MTLALVLSVLFLVLIGYGLERNERRQTGPKPPLTGSSDVPDRDRQRVSAELTALSGGGSAAGETASADRSRKRSAEAGSTRYIRVV